MDAVRTIRRDLPVAALVLFHADKERDWRGDSSPDALAGLRLALRH